MKEDTFPDIGSMSDQELKELIDNLTAEEQEVSYRRRILHGQIDILRAELVNRLRENRPDGATLIKGDDVQRLSEILAGRSEPPTMITSCRAMSSRASDLDRGQSWRFIAPSAGSSTPKGPTTARSAAPISPARRGRMSRRR